jgi:restriction system protein
LETQIFMGALQLPGADRGVLMTSGDFSKPAIDIAAKAKNVIVLIDDAEMARLIVKFEVGAERWAMKVPTLRADASEK